MSYKTFCKRYNALKEVIAPVISDEAEMVMFCGEFVRRGITPTDIYGMNAEALREYWRRTDNV